MTTGTWKHSSTGVHPLHDPLRSALARGHEVDHVDTLRDRIRRLLYKGSKLVVAGLIPGRHDLYLGNDLAVPVLDGDSVCLTCIDRFFGAPD